GVNWGSAAFDPVNQILLANVSHAAHIITLIPREQAKGFNPPPGHDFGQQEGAPFAMSRALAMTSVGTPCNKPPWGETVAVDLKAGKILWHSTVASGRAGLPAPVHFRSLPMEIAMKITASIMFAAALALSSAPASATVLDLSTMTCKQFVEGGDDTI
ncbi:hypothetical protein ADUPG1_004364, partial [Aduncisulcus paluster]